MNTKRKFQFFVLLALAAMLILPFAVQAYAAPAARAGCAQVLQEAEATLARIDMPKTRAEYAALDRIAECLADARFAIPVTGRTVKAVDRSKTYMDLKMELVESINPVRFSNYHDEAFIRFKERQIELKSR